ncbi:MAG: hypothetical protein OSB00_15225 [Sphingomonas bacterium]|nr:hypothetical protein [Sphingomonas bacterium]
MARELYLPERFCITIEGKLWRIHQRSVLVPKALPHLLDRLLTGQMVTAEAFEPFGIRLSIEVCTDQGDDCPDDIELRSAPLGNLGP